MISIFRAGCSINRTKKTTTITTKRSQKMRKDNDISNFPRKHAVTKQCSHLIYSLSNPAVLFYIFNQKNFSRFHHCFYISEWLQTLYCSGCIYFSLWSALIQLLCRMGGQSSMEFTAFFFTERKSLTDLQDSKLILFCWCSIEVGSLKQRIWSKDEVKSMLA